MGNFVLLSGSWESKLGPIIVQVHHFYATEPGELNQETYTLTKVTMKANILMNKGSKSCERKHVGGLIIYWANAK